MTYILSNFGTCYCRALIRACLIRIEVISGMLELIEVEFVVWNAFVAFFSSLTKILSVNRSDSCELFELAWVASSLAVENRLRNLGVNLLPQPFRSDRFELGIVHVAGE